MPAHLTGHRPGRRTTDQMRLLLIGAPGAGKGTQAELLAKRFGITHISSGDLLRQHVKDQTSLGQKIKSYVDNGDLVPDGVVMDMLRKPVVAAAKAGGYVLDGFPRTVEQAKKLDDMLGEQKAKIDRVVKFDIADDVLVDRVEGRLVHPPSGRSYHVRNAPPKVAMKDDVTGEALEHRADDNADTLRKRLASYHAQTTPVAAYYQQKSIVSSINADAAMPSVYGAVKKAMDM